jgi:hypothetical protein
MAIYIESAVTGSAFSTGSFGRVEADIFSGDGSQITGIVGSQGAQGRQGYQGRQGVQGRQG